MAFQTVSAPETQMQRWVATISCLKAMTPTLAFTSVVKDLQSKGTDVESIRIDDEEFERIMNRNRLYGEGEDAIPTEGKMYDVIEGNKGDMLGTMRK
jgi:hypothetical protein